MARAALLTKFSLDADLNVRISYVITEYQKVMNFYLK